MYTAPGVPGARHILALGVVGELETLISSYRRVSSTHRFDIHSLLCGLPVLDKQQSGLLLPAGTRARL